jgi:hypothetical protein
MSIDSTLAADVQTLLDKQAIAEVLYRRSRASDRCDVALALSCYHDGATEVHPGALNGLARDFILRKSEMAKGEASTMYMMWHALLNMIIDVDGDRAFSETYNIAISRQRDERGDVEARIGGRLLDRFERREGRWAIVHREIVMDWSWVMPVGKQYWEGLPSQEGVVVGVRGAADALYKYIDRHPA